MEKVDNSDGSLLIDAIFHLFEAQHDCVIHICPLIAKIKVTDTKITVPGTRQTRPAPICGKWCCAYLISLSSSLLRVYSQMGELLPVVHAQQGAIPDLGDELLLDCLKTF